MKRTEINENLLLALDFFQAYRFLLPKWAVWRKANWEHCGPEADEIRQCRLGWEISDFGRGQFSQLGALRFVLRRGAPAVRRRDKPYEESIGLCQVEQVMPMHYHPERMVDLTNRGGGELVVQVQAANERGRPDNQSRVGVSVNGISYNLKPGGMVRLTGGDWISLRPGTYCKFWAEKAGCLVGELGSMATSAPATRYLDDIAWETEIEEDEPALYLLSHEYPEFE